MLKHTVKYTDFDNEEQEETLYFNLTKMELAENLEPIQSELEYLRAIVEGEKREITNAEVKRVLEFVKLLMRLSYGVRSDDGKRFTKKNVWDDFESSAAYSEYLFNLFYNTDNAMAFILGIVPKELVEEAKVLVNKENPELFGDVEVQDVSLEQAKEIGVTVEADTVPVWIKELREPTPDEVRNMTPEQLREEYFRKMKN